MDHQNQAQIPILSTSFCQNWAEQRQLQFLLIMVQQYPELRPFSAEVYREFLRRQEATRQSTYLQTFITILPEGRGRFLDNFPVYPAAMDPYLRHFVGIQVMNF